MLFRSKAIAWDMAKYYAKPIPGVTFNESELRIDYPNGGQVRLYGADSPDALRGLYLDGVVVDEYGLCDADLFGPVLRPFGAGSFYGTSSPGLKPRALFRTPLRGYGWSATSPAQQTWSDDVMHRELSSSRITNH